jgi:WD40 repeat protein
VTSNSSDAPVESVALSPDGKYLAYSDESGIHVRSMQTGDSRVLPDTKGMFVFWWAADATQFYGGKKRVNEQFVAYDFSLAGGTARVLGSSIPSPSGKYSVTISADFHSGFGGIRNGSDGKFFPLQHNNGVASFLAWAPHDKYAAVRFTKAGRWDVSWIEALNPENGRWTTLVSPQQEARDANFRPEGWLSDRELIYVKTELTPRNDTNLWTVKVDPATGLPSGMPQRRTRWTDFDIWMLSVNANASRLCFVRRREESDIYIGDIQAHGRRLTSPRQFTRGEARNYPYAWTPDSRAVVFASNRDGPFRIYKQDIEQDTAELITHNPGSQNGPRMSPDGQWLLYWNWLPGDPRSRLMRTPLGGGANQAILSSEDTFPDISCSHTPGGGCILVEMQGKSEIVSLIDPVKGRGPKIVEIMGDFTRNPAMSPDGQHIAFVLPGVVKNRIRIVDLNGAIESEITVPGAEYLASLDWSADGTDFFSEEIRPLVARLVHIQRDGAFQVLWAQTAGVEVWGIPSPDGRHLATFRTRLSDNVWMVENP